MLDGTLIATDRCTNAPAGYAGTNQDPYYSGKHHRHGVNVQGMIGPHGELLYLGEARCGSTHDTAAARADEIIEAAVADVEPLQTPGKPNTTSDLSVRKGMTQPQVSRHLGRLREAGLRYPAGTAGWSITGSTLVA